MLQFHSKISFMKKLVLFLLLISFSINAKSGKVNLSGTIKNNTLKFIKITYLNDQELVSDKINNDGYFKMRTKLEGAYYKLKYGRSTTFIYLHPEDDLKINFDANDIQKTLRFSGKGAARNNYLINKARETDKITNDIKAYYGVGEVEYLKNIDSLKNVHLKALDQYETKPFFNKAEKKSLEYERLFSIQNFASSKEFYLGKDVELSKEFYRPLRKLDLSKKLDFKTQPFYRFLVTSIWLQKFDETENFKEMISLIKKVKNNELKVNLLKRFYSKVSVKEDRAKDYYKLINRTTNYKPFLEATEKRYQETLSKKYLKEGSKSPDFNYEDVNGNHVSLSDFRGKFVYLDIWATWCAPCLKQIPYLKKIEKRYHDKNIVFISISVDKESSKSKWKKMVEKKNLVGIHLFADHSFNSEFMEKFSVNSIPRFILINPEGEIIDNDAPRPSYDMTTELFDDLLN